MAVGPAEAEAVARLAEVAQEQGLQMALELAPELAPEQAQRPESPRQALLAEGAFPQAIRQSLFAQAQMVRSSAIPTASYTRSIAVPISMPPFS